MKTEQETRELRSLYAADMAVLDSRAGEGLDVPTLRILTERYLRAERSIKILDWVLEQGGEDFKKDIEALRLEHSQKEEQVGEDGSLKGEKYGRK